MNKDIYPIYHNKFGIAFQWKHDFEKKKRNRIQMVFRDLGFYLTVDEIDDFRKAIEVAKVCKDCKCCKSATNERFILVKTPSDKVDMAVSENELKQMEDLFDGTLFQLRLDSYLEQLCKN